MSLAVEPEAPPIRQDPDGAFRVGNTHVLFELVVRAYEDGATPEGIVLKYSALEMGDVYAVIGYYLRHQGDVTAYLAERDRQAERVRQRVEASQDLRSIRERIHAARKS